jgi:hypothetical protein
MIPKLCDPGYLLSGSISILVVVLFPSIFCFRVCTCKANHALVLYRWMFIWYTTVLIVKDLMQRGEVKSLGNLRLPLILRSWCSWHPRHKQRACHLCQYYNFIYIIAARISRITTSGSGEVPVPLLVSTYWRKMQVKSMWNREALLQPVHSSMCPGILLCTYFSWTRMLLWNHHHFLPLSLTWHSPADSGRLKEPVKIQTLGFGIFCSSHLWRDPAIWHLPRHSPDPALATIPICSGHPSRPRSNCTIGPLAALPLKSHQGPCLHPIC